VKSLLVSVFMGFFIFSAAATAAENAMFGGGATPIQAFHQAGSTAKSAKLSQPMVKPKLATKPARESQVAQTALQKGHAALQAQLTQLNQTNLMFHQDTDQKIETLSNKNAQLAKQVSRLGEALSLMNQELAQMSPTSHTTFSPTTPSRFDTINQMLKKGSTIALYVLLLAAAILIILLSTRRRQMVTESGEEYDFMGSEEGIPAKLDLAHAYVSMEDYEQANAVLNDVLSHGNSNQRQEAQTLIDDIQKKL